MDYTKKIMNTIIKISSIVLGSFLFIYIVILLFVWLTYNIKGDAVFEEDTKISLYVSDEVNQACYPQTSYVMSSISELEAYIERRTYLNRQPFIGQLVFDSIDFVNYDYVFSERYSIQRMKILLYDDCSSYHTESLDRKPLYFEFNDNMTDRVFVYKISPKGKYRIRCE